ncbi:hypothetical protein AXG93_3789s1110 [Marchantia polymorpha subsp. ruderalis]|uniref:Uncharacterized protein n=1 Tax=Marchantia polymorpha subsp. ruderalis TaxID=1480154 RepID=A0A176WFJ0_MARPO|nr:hypothetical protein AXG93_3789s1110 [Marchantia polymorpha subsp. ruderalis]
MASKRASEYVKANDDRFGLRVLSKDPKCSNKHPSKWAEYKRINSSDDRKAFFDDVPVSFKNSIKPYFPSSSLGAEREMVFDIKKNIVDVIVGDMMFEANDDDIDNNPDDDMNKPPAFGSNAKRNAVRQQRAQ